MAKTHEMILVQGYSDGRQKWNCPICGRVLLFTLQPKFKYNILVQGDDMTEHVGHTGGIAIIGVTLQQVTSEAACPGLVEGVAPEPEPAAYLPPLVKIDLDDPTLAAFKEWSDKHDELQTRD